MVLNQGKSRYFKRLMGLIVVWVMVTFMMSTGAVPQVRIKFITLGSTQIDILDEMVGEFEKKNPDIKVEWENWPYKDAYEKYVTVAKAGTPPECGYAYAIMLPEFVERGVLVPVENYISNDLKEDFFQPLLRRASYKGTLWALPAWFSTNLITYRKNLLNKYGFEVPDTPEEVIELAKKMHNPPEMYGAVFPAGQSPTYAVRWFATQLWGRGGKFLTEDKRKAAFNSEAGVEALEYLTDLVPYYPPGYLDMGEHGVARAFRAGKFPWIQMSMGFAVLHPKQEHPEWELDPAFSPTPKKVALGIMDIYFLFKTTPEKQEAAWKWLEFTQQPKYTEHTNIEKGFNPTRKSAAEYYRNTEYYQKHPAREAINEYIEAAKYVQWPPYSPKWYEIEYILQEAFQKSFTGRLSPKKALDKAAKRVDEILAEFYGE